jgi:hypothetical protein
MSADLQVDFKHPANAGILRYLRRAHPLSVARGITSCSPASISDPYYHLSTHPDLVERFWDQITVRLPVSCRWVVYGIPTLVHPNTGIIFGFAGGTLVYALRLSPVIRQTALDAGAPMLHSFSDRTVLDLSRIGADWVFGAWLPGEEDWCLAGYEYAGSLKGEIVPAE